MSDKECKNCAHNNEVAKNIAIAELKEAVITHQIQGLRADIEELRATVLGNLREEIANEIDHAIRRVEQATHYRMVEDTKQRNYQFKSMAHLPPGERPLVQNRGTVTQRQSRSIANG